MMQTANLLGSCTELRTQTSDDLVFLQDLFVARRWAEVSQVPGWDDTQRRAFLHAQAQLQRQHYEKHYAAADFLIIEQAGTPIGRLCIHRDAEAVRVVDIALLPGWRGQGIGTQWLQTVLAQADAAGQPCDLSVEQGNPARRLYHRLGFQACGESGIHTQMRRPARPSPE
jgi:GNAT superfamily N-acetyltransferase